MKRKKDRGPKHPIGWNIEILEMRDLPSAIHSLAGPAPAHERGRPAAVQGPRAQADISSSGRGRPDPTPVFTLGTTQLTLQGPVSSSTSTVSQVSGAPTPHEQVRQNFTAIFYGPYIIGPPRYTGYVSQTYASAGGFSTAFLRGNVQLGFQTPSSASQGPTGTATLFPKNYMLVSSILTLQIQGDPTQPHDGRPTMLNWVVSTGSGAFTGASGSGTLQLIYRPGNGGFLHASGWGRGNVALIFRGVLFLSGTNNALRINSA